MNRKRLVPQASGVLHDEREAAQKEKELAALLREELRERLLVPTAVRLPADEFRKRRADGREAA